MPEPKPSTPAKRKAYFHEAHLDCMLESLLSLQRVMQESFPPAETGVTPEMQQVFMLFVFNGFYRHAYPHISKRIKTQWSTRALEALNVRGVYGSIYGKHKASYTKILKALITQMEQQPYAMLLPEEVIPPDTD
jgi:hypothetical protein